MPSDKQVPTIAQALQQAAAVGLARIDAQMLLLHTLGQSTANRAWLLAHDTELLDDTSQHRWQTLMQRRLQGEPVAYLVGEHEFFGLNLNVTPHVLDPRPDTETLVQWALDLARDKGTTPLQIADLGTGSGAIACALTTHLPHATIWASDASMDALAVAKRNAQRLQLPIRFCHGDWFGAFADLDPAPRFDLIASNPPYLAAEDPHLRDLQHEPVQALISGDDGLDAIRILLEQAPDWLQADGWLLLEHGYDQADAVQSLLQQRGFAHVQGRKDLAGIVRCSGGQWAG